MLRAGSALCIAVFAAGCAGGGSQGGVMMPAGASGGITAGVGSGNTVVRIFVPAGTQPNLPIPRPLAPLSTPTPGLPGTSTLSQTPPAAPVSTPPVATPPPAPGSQPLSISVTGPTTITQTVSVGPNSPGCAPSAGGATCQLTLALPAGTYTGTIGSAAIAFTVTPSSNNALNLTLGGIPAQIAIVPATSMSVQNAQGGVDLYGAAKHLLLVEMLDPNQNVMVGGGGASFSLGQAGGSLPVTVTQASTLGPNLFYVTAAPAPSGSSAVLRAAATSMGPASPCSQAGALCTGTIRVDVRQLLAVANSGSSSVALYVNGQVTPLGTIQTGVAIPQALVFDASGNLFVANEPGSVSEYAAPYNQAPTAIASGINHPQALALDAHGDLFVANGSGSNTVTVYSPPYGGSPSTTISANVNDPVSLALDPSGDLFVVNSAANTVTEYAPPYTSPPTVISKGLNTPSSMALDPHGDLFVANLNSTPNSIVEYAPPFSSQSAPVATITNGVNEQGSISLTATTLFVPNQGANTVTEYTPPYTSAPTTIVGGQSQPLALAVDAFGNLFVANYGNNTVTEYAAPYAPGSWTTLSSGINAPLALALSPATNGGPTLLP